MQRGGAQRFCWRGTVRYGILEKTKPEGTHMDERTLDALGRLLAKIAQLPNIIEARRNRAA